MSVFVGSIWLLSCHAIFAFFHRFYFCLVVNGIFQLLISPGLSWMPERGICTFSWLQFSSLPAACCLPYLSARETIITPEPKTHRLLLHLGLQRNKPSPPPLLHTYVVLFGAQDIPPAMSCLVYVCEKFIESFDKTENALQRERAGRGVMITRPRADSGANILAYQSWPRPPPQPPTTPPPAF